MDTNNKQYYNMGKKLDYINIIHAVIPDFHSNRYFY